MAMSRPLAKRLWQVIVKAKIANQAALLEENARGGVNELRALVSRVGSGDPDNVEARAARVYWSNLFETFRRSDEDDLRNKQLNYGYAVIRAGLARAIVGAGFLPSIGLQHASDTNAFNLADDLIEPFRPFVDRLVLSRTRESGSSSELTIDDRRALAGCLHVNVRMGQETMRMLAAAEKCVETLGQAINIKDARGILLPTLDAPNGEKRQLAG